MSGTGNGKLPEIVRLEAEVEQMNARLARAHKEIRRLRAEFRSLAHVWTHQPVSAGGEFGVAVSICQEAERQSWLRYPDAEDD